jgi:hypothetical protein
MESMGKSKVYLVSLMLTPYVYQKMTKESLVEISAELLKDSVGKKTKAEIISELYILREKLIEYIYGGDMLLDGYRSYKKILDELKIDNGFVNRLGNIVSKDSDNINDEVYDVLESLVDGTVQKYNVANRSDIYLLLSAFASAIVLAIPDNRMDLLPEITSVVKDVEKRLKFLSHDGSEYLSHSEGGAFVHTNHIKDDVTFWDYFLKEVVLNMKVFINKGINKFDEGFADAVSKKENIKGKYLKDSSNVLDPTLVVAFTKAIFRNNFTLKEVHDSYRDMVAPFSTVKKHFERTKYEVVEMGLS